MDGKRRQSKPVHPRRNDGRLFAERNRQPASAGECRQVPQIMYSISS